MLAAIDGIYTEHFCTLTFAQLLFIRLKTEIVKNLILTTSSTPKDLKIFFYNLHSFSPPPDRHLP
jgi:hypothetical protein